MNNRQEDRQALISFLVAVQTMFELADKEMSLLPALSPLRSVYSELSVKLRVAWTDALRQADIQPGEYELMLAHLEKEVRRRG
jgi:hypothetical protein